MEHSPSSEAIRFSASQEIPHILWTRSFVIAFTSARHLSLSRASWIQSISPTSHFLKIHPNIILPSTSGSPKWYLSFRFPHQKPVYASPLPHRRYMTHHLILLDFTTRTILVEQYRSFSSSLFCLLHSPCHLIPLKPKNSPQHPNINHTEPQST